MPKTTATAIALLTLLVPVAQAQQAPCRCPGRAYPTTPTAEVRRLFAAAERADTTAFLSALAAVPAPDSFAIDETPLIATILWARRWPKQSRNAEYRTYSTVLRTSLDSVQTAHRASWPARERMLAAALARKVDPDGFVPSGIPPLLLAAVMGSPHMIDLLLTAGANPNVELETFDNVNAIEFALDHEFRFRMLAFPEFVTVGERTTIVRRLLRAGTKAPWAGERFRMPAHSPWALIAALTEGDSIARDLLAAGLSATQVDVAGIPPITAAAQFANLPVVGVLRDNGPRSATVVADSIVWGNTAPNDTTGTDTGTDLWLDAAIASAADTTARIADLLLQRSMRWNQTGPLGVVDNVPAHHRGVYGRSADTGDARDRTDAATAAPMVSTSSPLGRSSGSSTIAQAAAEVNNVALLRRLKAFDVPLDDSSQYGWTPLASATRAGAWDAARWLQANGADPLRGGETKSALTAALEAISGSAGNARDSVAAATFANDLLRGVTRQQLTDAGDLAWLAGTITRRVSPAIPALNALVERGWTPPALPMYLLSTAIIDRDTALVSWLLEHRVALVQTADRRERSFSIIGTPLMLAVAGGDKALVTRLLNAGATVHTAGRREGLTPLGVALRVENDTMADLLRRAGDTLDSIATPLLLGLALQRDDAALLDAVAARRDRPIRAIPPWSAVGQRLLTDTAALGRALAGGLRPDAFLLRYPTEDDEPDASSGSLLELLILAAAETVAAPSDAPRIDALLTARINTLARSGVVPTLLARNARETSSRAAAAPVVTLSIGLRRATLALLSASPGRISPESRAVLLGIAVCRNDREVATVVRRGGARPMPAAEQRALCSRLGRAERAEPAAK